MYFFPIKTSTLRWFFYNLKCILHNVMSQLTNSAIYVLAYVITSSIQITLKLFFPVFRISLLRNYREKPKFPSHVFSVWSGKTVKTTDTSCLKFSSRHLTPDQSVKFAAEESRRKGQEKISNTTKSIYRASVDILLKIVTILTSC